MLAFPNELRTLSADDLMELVEAYLVRSHDGTPYRGPQQPDQIISFILNWTQPDSGPVQENRFLEAIQNGVRFNSEAVTDQDQINDLLKALFGDKLKVSPKTIEDFANYPMRNYLDQDPWILLQGYVRSENQPEYFEQMTGQPWNKFLNESERLFFLTRGYGRPNRYISQRDLFRRQLYLTAQPTALIPLMDLFGVCAGNQNPSVILERLLGIDLSSIDRYHENAVQQVSDCLTGVTCQMQQCSSEHVNCFKGLLRSLGILDDVEYDPVNQVFRSNLSQLNLYQNVVPGKEWSFEEVENLPDPLVQGILAQLPDRQLIKIEVPSGLKLSDTLELKQVEDRFRSKLLRSAEKFLLSRHYLLGEHDGQVSLFYGRLVDSQLDQMNLSEVEASVEKHQALIDSLGRVMNLVEARAINQTVESPIIANVIEKTMARALQNDRLVESFSSEDRAALQELFEKLSQGGADFDVETIKTILLEDPLKPEQLLLYAKTFQDWTPVAMTFEEYFSNWYPLYQTLVRDSLDYYSQTLQE